MERIIENNCEMCTKSEHYIITDTIYDVNNKYIEYYQSDKCICVICSDCLSVLYINKINICSICNKCIYELL
uniref:Uncharacterized protein n=1 Tax=viral metagenome TaxID=1070528 RepID=A0A6C0I754_9ZZZZ